MLGESGKIDIVMVRINEHSIDSLYKYFIWSNRMKYHFDCHIKKSNCEFDSKNGILTNLYLSFWLSELYVVIEGWEELGLTDSTVDIFLKSTDNIKLLKRYRNGVFHFKKKFFDDRFTNFIIKDDSLIWARDLHLSFSKFF